MKTILTLAATLLLAYGSTAAPNAVPACRRHRNRRPYRQTPQGKRQRTPGHPRPGENRRVRSPVRLRRHRSRRFRSWSPTPGHNGRRQRYRPHRHPFRRQTADDAHRRTFDNGLYGTRCHTGLRGTPDARSRKYGHHTLRSTARKRTGNGTVLRREQDCRRHPDRKRYPGTCIRMQPVRRSLKGNNCKITVTEARRPTPASRRPASAASMSPHPAGRAVR